MSVGIMEGVSPAIGASEQFSQVRNPINPYLALRLKSDFVKMAHSVHAFVAPIFEAAVNGHSAKGQKYSKFGKSLIAFCHKFMNYGGENFNRRVRKVRWNQKKQHNRLAVSREYVITGIA